MTERGITNDYVVAVLCMYRGKVMNMEYHFVFDLQ